MAGKSDIKEEKFLQWDQFEGKPPNLALQAIYAHVEAFSSKSREWYWVSIRNKRLKSTIARFITFLLAAFGVVAPIIAAIWQLDEAKFLWSQLAVVALAVAGMMQLADRVFGWSSGWLRYMSTVTEMENATRQFQLEWAMYFVDLRRSVTAEEVKPLFDMAQRFQARLGELQSSETDGWIAEFNTGRVMLSEVVKSARDAAEKTATEARSASKALADASSPGAIELTVATTLDPPPTLAISLDHGPLEPCRGLTWVRLKVGPGLHQLVIEVTHHEKVIAEIHKVVEVPPGAPTRLTVPVGPAPPAPQPPPPQPPPPQPPPPQPPLPHAPSPPPPPQQPPAPPAPTPPVPPRGGTPAGG